MPARVTETEWLKEMQRLSSRSDEGMTTDEWCDALGRSLQYVRGMLLKASKMGWLVRGKRTKEAINGRIFNADVYKIVRPTEPKKRRSA